jgi:hypothetical protein
MNRSLYQPGDRAAGHELDCGVLSLCQARNCHLLPAAVRPAGPPLAGDLRMTSLSHALRGFQALSRLHQVPGVLLMTMLPDSCQFRQ